MTREQMIKDLCAHAYTRGYGSFADAAAQLQADGETIARLEAELAKAHADMDATMKGWDDLCASSDKADAKVAELETALDPFVKYIVERSKVIRHAPGETIGDFWRGAHRCAIRLDDLERARTALRPADKGEAP